MMKNKMSQITGKTSRYYIKQLTTPYGVVSYIFHPPE